MISFGTSIGIAVRGDNLEIVCARGRWNRVVVTGFLRVENFLSRPQGEVAELYRRFRRENHAATTSATVALPRGAGLIRFLNLPAEVAPNLAQAVEYQVDLLHPFEEGSMAWDWALLPASPPRRAGSSRQAEETSGQQLPASLSVGVALAEKQAVEKLADWFRAAGIDVACFTLAGGAMYRALRAAAAPAQAGSQAAPLVLLDGHGSTVEILAIASDGRFSWREVPASAPLEREVALSAAELRIAEGAYAVTLAGHFEGSPPVAGRRLEQLLGTSSPEMRPPRSPEQKRVRALDGRRPEFRLAEAFAAYAAALPGLEAGLPGLGRRRGLNWNLLPREKRVYRSHWAYTAACVLAVVALSLGAARVTAGWVQDRYYSAWLDSQTRALVPRVQYLERLDSKQKVLLVKIVALEREQRNVVRKMGAWSELTRLLPSTVWLQSMSLTENQVTVVGQAESAAGLLQTIGQSPYFEQPEFISAVARNNEGREAFQIRIRLRETPLVNTPAPVAAAPPANGGKGGK